MKLKTAATIAVSVFGLVAGGAIATPAEAALFELSGVCTGGETDASCTKDASYDTDTNLLTITLTNTSTTSVGGFITADAFNLYDSSGNVIDVTSFSTTNTYFQLFENGPFGTPPPGGDERTTLISGSDGWTGSGAPTGGIAAGGGSATFTLTLDTDLTLATFTAVFLSEEIRFRGLTDGGSDKQGITPEEPGEEPQVPSPEPATLALFGLALVGAAYRQRKQRD